MAIIQGATDFYKVGLLAGTNSPYTNTWKIALYTSQANIGPSTGYYTTAGEVVASGYTAGGQVLTPSNTTIQNGVAYMTFSNVSWSGAITARGALIYDSTNANQTVCVLDFGADKTSTSTFTVQFPANGPTTSILRVA